MRFATLFVVFNEGFAERQAADGAGARAGCGFARVAKARRLAGLVQHLLDGHGGFFT